MDESVDWFLTATSGEETVQDFNRALGRMVSRPSSTSKASDGHISTLGDSVSRL
jgi:hypothetical protein